MFFFLVLMACSTPDESPQSPPPATESETLTVSIHGSAVGRSIYIQEETVVHVDLSSLWSVGNFLEMGSCSQIRRCCGVQDRCARIA